MSKMIKSSGALAAATLMSRVLGMVREMAYAAFMGNGSVAGAFILAFQVPNLFRRLLGEGALAAAFIPIFKEKEIREGEPAMWRCANAVISGLLAGAGAVTVLVMVAISVVLAAGYWQPERRLMFELLRMMFPYMLLVCLAAAYIGMANSRGHYFVPALGGVVLNLVMIASVFLLAPRLGQTLEQQIFGLAIGVLVAGSAQALFQLPLLWRQGYRWAWVSPWHDPAVREVVRKMLPASFGVAAFQINVLLTQSFSFWFDGSIVSSFNYAVRLMELPQGMFGVSLATYLLPTLSGLAAKRDYPEFRVTVRQGLGQLAFTNLFAAAMCLVLAGPIVRLLFERGRFGPADTHRAALALACLAPGLLMFSVNNILARAFYALKDIQTPVRMSIVCLVLNLGLALTLVMASQHTRVRGEVGLAVANTTTATLNTLLLLYALRRKLKFLGLTSLRRALLGSLAASVLAGALAAALAWLWERHFHHATLAPRLGAVFVPGAAATSVFCLLTLWWKVPAATEIAGLLLNKVRGTARV